MTSEEFKQIRLCSFSKFSDSVLEQYIEEGNKILARGLAIDDEVINILDSLLIEQANRGK